MKQYPCTCGSGLIGHYEYTGCCVFVCDSCSEVRVKKAVAEENLRAISGVRKWWRNPQLLHRFKRILSMLEIPQEERVWRAMSAATHNYCWHRLPRNYEVFFERG